MTSPGRTPEPRTPPTGADRLLAICLPQGALGDSIRGDLHEEFHAVPRSVIWYWGSALALSARYGMKRAAEALRERRRPSRRPSEYGWGDRMQTFWGDIRFGLRMLVKTPLMSIVAIVTIGMGVGLTTHMFSSVYGSAIQGLPIPESDRLSYVGRQIRQQGQLSPGVLVHHTYEDVRQAQTSFESLEAFYQGTVNLAGEEAPPERYQGAYVTADALRVVGVEPLLGRVFLPGEDGPNAPHQIVLSYNVWQNRFASDPAIIGKRVRANGYDTEIIGVMPEGARFPFLEDAWLPIRQDIATFERGAGYNLTVFGRLQEGVTWDVANQELAAIGGRLAELFPDTNEDVVLISGPYEEMFMPKSITTVLWVMLFATFGVLLIACTNVANILLARAAVRSKEVAVRTALGASRWRVVRQLLIEAGVLAFFGGLFGLVINEIAMIAYTDAVEGIYKPYWITFHTNTTVLGFSLGVTALAALLAGVLPAIRATGAGIGETLKDESRGASSLKMGRLTSLLVVSEIAVSCALLVGAGFMIRSIVNLNRVDYGIAAEQVLVGRVGLFETDYPDEAARDRFYQDLKERLAGEPGVRAVALGTSTPGLGGARRFTSVEGQVYESESDQPIAFVGEISNDYFEVLGVSMVQGREFTSLETQLGSDDPVAIVNQSFAARFIGDASPLGARVKVGGTDSEQGWARVIGVVPDLYVGGNTGGIGNDRQPPEQVFFPMGQMGSPSFNSVHIQTSGNPADFANDLRRIVAELDPNLPVYNLQPLDVAITELNWAFGLFGGMFSIFGLAALFLAAVGLYGVMSFSVRQRAKEMGVRMALGADGGRLLRLVLGKGVRQLTVGIALGLVVGGLSANSLEIIMYGVEAGDPIVYLAIAATLGLVGMIAVLIPARSATRTDPVEAMREG